MKLQEYKENIKKVINQIGGVPNFVVCGKNVFKYLKELPEIEQKETLSGVRFFLDESLKPNHYIVSFKYSPDWHTKPLLGVNPYVSSPTTVVKK